ncbi:hypothetical protein BLNAU_6766 [Blattamonas nauphoetae]|uniref:Uncharacterized protein n=1 Tax=Blattamonas nauphoetae TaxID=2049346 RepID=A0ABQ9Y3J1_9EUKA|nr:hypothetical protein BLNAU_6766 [Blattamonas nauphoetae]
MFATILYIFVAIYADEHADTPPSQPSPSPEEQPIPDHPCVNITQTLSAVHTNCTVACQVEFQFCKGNITDNCSKICKDKTHSDEEFNVCNTFCQDKIKSDCADSQFACIDTCNFQLSQSLIDKDCFTGPPPRIPRGFSFHIFDFDWNTVQCPRVNTNNTSQQ